VTDDYFAEPRGPGTPAKATAAEPPDASNKTKSKPPAQKPPAAPSKPGKGE
jgi:hypothetical protein